MFQVNDIVRLGGLEFSHTIVITALNPNRPKNCYSGVLANGRGKVYVFGDKHRPVKIGTAGPDHPALQAMQQRRESKSHQWQRDWENDERPTSDASKEYKAVVKRLVEAVKSKNWDRADFLADLIDEM